jgi:hypothetical protein
MPPIRGTPTPGSMTSWETSPPRPDVELHVVCDNYATHKHQNVKDWLAANPVTLHFTPTSCPLAEHGRNLLRPDRPPGRQTRIVAPVCDLENTIRTYIDSYNESAHLFRWVKTADYLLGQIKRKQTINT